MLNRLPAAVFNNHVNMIRLHHLSFNQGKKVHDSNMITYTVHYLSLYCTTTMWS